MIQGQNNKPIVSAHFGVRQLAAAFTHCAPRGHWRFGSLFSHSSLGISHFKRAATNTALLLPTAGGTNTDALRGLKGPVHIPSSYAWIGWLLAAVAAVVLAWYIWKRLSFRKPRVAAAVSIPPHRRAKDRLRSAGELMSDPYAFCSLVSDVVREYIEERFELHAPERTTEEFLEELRRTTALHVEHKRLLEEFLTHCDLVKFARHEPSHPELQGLLDAALRFIDETALTAEPAPVEAGQTT